MKIVSRRNVFIILGLMIFTAIATLSFINYKSASAAKGISQADFVKNKEARAIQEKIEAQKLGDEYRATHPIVAQAPLPKTPDPKTQPQRIPMEHAQLGYSFTAFNNILALWRVGDKPSSDQVIWDPSFAYSGSLKANTKQGFIATYIMDGEVDQVADNATWAGYWSTPQLWGAVTITNVVGDIVSFSTESGVNGTFNLITHAWKTK